MNVRQATPEDSGAIREIANRSLEASYSLSPQAIESAVTQWYDPPAFGEKLESDDQFVVYVAEVEDSVVGFTETVLLDDGNADLRWLHVHPDHRGEGVGSALFETTRDRLRERGVTNLRGRVLAINEAGNSFYQGRGFRKVGEGEVEIDGSPYAEVLYVEAAPTGLQPYTTDEGETVYVDHDDADRGSLAPFHVVYLDESRSEKYGYHCGKCDTLANAMDAMGRIECQQCANSRKPSRWDAAYM
jgi:ribosomal protein S18 acetylase RimI-like enzyme